MIHDRHIHSIYHILVHTHTPTSTIKKTQSNEPIAMMEWYLNTHAHTNSVYKSMRIFSHLAVDIGENKTKMGKFDMELVVCLAWTCLAMQSETKQNKTTTIVRVQYTHCAHLSIYYYFINWIGNNWKWLQNIALLNDVCSHFGLKLPVTGTNRKRWKKEFIMFQ